MNKKYILLIGCALAGLANGLLGTGGGIIALPILGAAFGDRKKAHKLVMAFILPLTILSFVLYLFKQSVLWDKALLISIGGIPGALLGAYLVRRLSTKCLKIIFAIIIIISGFKLII